MAAHRAAHAALSFEDVRGVEETRRWLVAVPSERRIVTDDSKVVWNIGAYDFLLDGPPLESIHPSLQRQAVLTMENGLC